MNYTQIAGHIGKDPETRFTPDGKKVTTFSMAINKKRKGQDITTWYRVTVWGEQFDRMMPYLKKGSAVCVVGDCDARLYTDKEGRPQISMELTAWNISFSPFGKSGTSSDNAPQATQTQSAGSDYAFSEPMRGSMTGSDNFSGGFGGGSDENDNLPF